MAIKYLWSAYCVPGNMLSPGNTAVKKTGKVSAWGGRDAGEKNFK